MTIRPDDPTDIRAQVRDGYAAIAERPGIEGEALEQLSHHLGYGADDLVAIPEGANLGLGCGNPTAIDTLQPGEVVLDLGAGAGMDAFLAARQVGPDGRVIGVDMTEEMTERARTNAERSGITNVEFRLGHIEELPVEDTSVDVIISNCVINLSPEKHRVFAEAYRVLRPSGRLLVSDIVLDRTLPDAVMQSVDAYLGCVGGASLRSEYLDLIHRSGFQEVRVDQESSFAHGIDLDEPRFREVVDGLGLTDAEASAYVDAVRSLHVFARK